MLTFSSTFRNSKSVLSLACLLQGLWIAGGLTTHALAAEKTPPPAAAKPAPDDGEPPPEATEQWTPVPPIVSAPANAPPSDAVALFTGTSLDAWEPKSAETLEWKVTDGALVVQPGSGDIKTKQSFGDIQLHLEFRTPTPAQGDSQGRGNSGVFFMGRYELQILDSFDNKTYVNGQAASVYKQYAPLANTSRPPGEWQTYDVLFYAPKPSTANNSVIPARMTVFHNGVLVQNDVIVRGATVDRGEPVYQRHAAKLPLVLQDHGNAVAFRNIWVRDIKRADSDLPAGQ